MSVRVIIADDHPIVSQGIQATLRPHGIEVVANVKASEEIPNALQAHQPSVLVMETRLANSDALKILEAIPEDFDVNRVVVFSGFSNRSNIARASALGCHDFVPKSADSNILVAAVQRAAAGDPTPASSLLALTRTRMRRGNPSKDVNHPLTSRELQVLRHVAMGLSNREVGKALGISVETVKEHVQNILRKLNVNDRTQAAVWAVRGGFI